MSPHFKGTLTAFLLLFLLVVVAQCTVDAEAEEDSQKIWACDNGITMITMHEKAALCRGGECVWFDWLSSIMTKDSLLLGYRYDETNAMIIRQAYPDHHNKAEVVVKDQALGVSHASCEYHPPLSARDESRTESSPEG